jgi:chaperonin GroEL (HSP60 family)
LCRGPKILEKDQYNFGYDAQTGEYGNLVSKGIIDPCVCRKLDSAILVMKAAENRPGCDCAVALNNPMNGRIQV